jgi:hypothetical protein
VPAAAVIPAPIAYIKIVAVKKLVVGSAAFWILVLVHSSVLVVRAYLAGIPLGALHRVLIGTSTFTLKKLECSKQASRLNSGAWNNGIGPRFYFVGFRNPEVMIKRDRRGHSYCDVRGEILGSSQDGLLRKHLPRMFSLIKNES